MNKKLAFAAILFSGTTIATFGLGMVFLQKIYMLTLKKSLVLGTLAAFTIGAAAGAYFHKRGKKAGS